MTSTVSPVGSDASGQAPEPEPGPASAPAPKGRIRRIAEEEHILVVLLAGFGLIFLLIFPPALVVNDSWLNLMAGREVVEHGLPNLDEITVYGLGATWTDQQWLAQVFMYGAVQPRRFRAPLACNRAFVVGAFSIAAAAARSLGAGPRAIWVMFLPVLMAAPWAWSIRAQMLALPLYTGLLWLLSTQARRPSEARLDRAADARRLGQPARERRARCAARHAARRLRTDPRSRLAVAEEPRADRPRSA